MQPSRGTAHSKCVQEVWSPALKFWTHRVLTSSLPPVVASPSQVCSCLLPVQSGRRPAPTWATSGRVLQPGSARSAHRQLGLRLRGLYEVGAASCCLWHHPWVPSSLSLALPSLGAAGPSEPAASSSPPRIFPPEVQLWCWAESCW